MLINFDESKSGVLTAYPVQGLMVDKLNASFYIVNLATRVTIAPI